MNNNGLRIVAIVLILAGVIALVYRSFTYTKETHEAKVGPIEVSVKDKSNSGRGEEAVPRLGESR